MRRSKSRGVWRTLAFTAPGWVGYVNKMRIWGFLLTAVCLASAVEIPAGTQVQIRLTSAINTATAKVNQQFDAVVIAPVVSGDGIAIAAGVRVTGHIKELTQAVKPEDQAILALSFDRLADKAGKQANLTARRAGIGKSRQDI